MTPRYFYLFFATIIVLALWDPASADQRPETTPLIQEPERHVGPGITIIRLKYADAEELAATLRPILPEGVKVVPYPPLNALIITRQPAAPQPPRR